MKPTKRKFVFWRIDSHYNSKETQEPVIEIVNYLSVIGISDTDSLVVIDQFSRHYEIGEEYLTTESPIWYKDDNERYGYIIRESFPERDMTPILALTAIVKENNN